MVDVDVVWGVGGDTETYALDRVPVMAEELVHPRTNKLYVVHVVRWFPHHINRTAPTIFAVQTPTEFMRNTQ